MNCRIVFAFLTICIYSTLIFPFHTLQDLQTYAQSHPEFPLATSQNWLDPDYTDFYISAQPNNMMRILNFLGVTQTDTLLTSFYNLLNAVTINRTYQKLSGDLVAHLHVPVDTTCIIWGDVHAAFHSLVQGLTDLYQQHIIDGNLKLIQENCHLIFNGDFINRSPYSVEVLYVILLLMKQNPDRIWYIRGKHESNQYWYNFGLKRQLILQADRLSSESIPFAKALNTFFNTLPHALYISTGNKPYHVIRISHRDRSFIQEQLLGALFSESEEPIRYYDIHHKKPSTAPVDVKAVIKTENWMRDQLSQYGLGMPEQDLGATSWTVLSSPTQVHQRYSHLFYDAFAIIHIADPIEHSTITLRNQYIKERTGFKNYAVYNIVSGSQVDSTKTSVSIGSTMALVQGVSDMGQRIKQGMSIAINNYNKDPNNAYAIRTFLYNDNYAPALARKNIMDLLQQHIDTILLPIGTPTLQNYLDLVKQNQVTVFFPVTGGIQFRNPDLKRLIHLRSSYQDEVKALVKYLITEYGVKKFAFFYEDNDYGRPPLQTAHEELPKYGITSWVDIPYTRGFINLKEQAQKIRNAQPDVIGFFATSHSALELIRQVGIEHLASQILFGISFLGEETIRSFLAKSGLRMIFGAVVPNPFISDLPIAQAYRQLMQEYHYQPDVYTFEAYIATSLFLDASHHIKPPITAEKLLLYFESLNHYEFQGLTLTFNKERRDLSMPVWIETGKTSPWISYQQDHDREKKQSI